MGLSQVDLIIFIGYLCIMVGIGLWIANKEKTKTTKDYFLASKSLPWWAIGGSLIASNISSEQIIGMNGSGFAIGIAISSYELMAALTLILVGKFFLPVFLKEGISTMPQFLEKRYDSRTRNLMAVFWVALFVGVNITATLLLGAKAIEQLTDVSMTVGIVGLILYTASFSIFGGLKAVVWTDVIQVVVLMVGGFAASWAVMTYVGDGSFFGGISRLMELAPEKFDLIFDKDVMYTDISSGEEKSAYALLPGIGVLIGGMWIANIYYWGTNQYIIQRALGAKSLKEAQRGISFAALVKIIMPLFVVLPGIAAFAILNNAGLFGFEGEGITEADAAFPWVLDNFIGSGFKGLVFAGLIAAIGSSLSSMVNSASTIFTLDVYKPLIKKDASEMHYVRVGKLTAFFALLFGGIIAPLLGSIDQVFQYIQEYTGLISPGVVALFIFGILWKGATGNGGFFGILASVLFMLIMKFSYPELPFLEQMALGFAFTILAIYLISKYDKNRSTSGEKNHTSFSSKLGLSGTLAVITLPMSIIGLIENPSGIFSWVVLLALMILGVLIWRDNTNKDPNAFDIDTDVFKTDKAFNIVAAMVIFLLTLIYISLW
jgi:SSS family solute:Na+ symporter